MLTTNNQNLSLFEDGDAAFKTIKMIESPKVFIKNRLDFVGQKKQFGGAFELINGPLGVSPSPKKPVESVVSGIGSDSNRDYNAAEVDETPLVLARRLKNQSPMGTENFNSPISEAGRPPMHNLSDKYLNFMQ